MTSDRGKGEYLDMDEDKRRQLDQQEQEYVDEAPALPNMNADPGARAADASDPTDRVES